ncbi:bifunctional UDP-2,4-diacetamido-2,4,6-trideoxy-beta-L-altropyranose hydrolase/GNAT family N-acetyltransferase [Exiguobacterium sp. KJ 601]|uniref:bifunctional UDP-2,4-diacetamido-2,4,6-trideoxy-beta-L-altropyranose hydrolase/GNAT family N-acetyltransferase n=1 Tax=Exiguobacterium sp. KJ 601 TaxID=2782569 RepID=UPI0022B00C02|nr:bifunctional UDP-2,4-diacetamido-2,4,6-trideoxy-beta-L-altropyranose hydrolase/GNAT family N-acetyltransferase [Exiguobacterium sp. KJ 601]
MKVMIFTEGGKRTGFGHLTRCIALYDEVKRRGIEVELIVQSDVDLRNLVGDRYCTIINWYIVDYLYRVVQSDFYCIVDSYIATRDLYQVIAQRSKSAIFLDDTNRIHYPDGIVVHPSLSTNDVPSGSLAGPKYIILRDAFREEVRPFIRQDVTNVLITVGGTLQPSLIQSIVHLICFKHPEITFHILIGDKYDPILERELLSVSNIILHRYVPSHEMKRLMSCSDLVITAAGQTIYELIISGVPFVPIKIAENQERNMLALRSRKLISSNVTWESSTFAQDLQTEFKRMLPMHIRTKQTMNYDGLLDGNGPLRIIDSLLYNKGNNLFLRKATLQDSRQVFELSNQKYVRKYSINQKSILWETHQIWYKKVLLSKQYLFLIVTDYSNQVLGQIRYERITNHAVISISLSERLIGKRVSQPLIQQSLMMVQQVLKDVREIKAYISNENIASKKAFERVGFEMKAHEDDNKLLTYIYKME